jgi:peptide/nickel transport system ATP-binding protein
MDVDRLDDYPHQFSGGMRQRVVIAMALALDPKLIIADEPTTGLDVIVQDKIINSILQIQEETDSSLLLITHDIGVIAETCDELSVLYGGKVLEQGTTENVLLHPANPYTMGLVNAFPDPGADDQNLVSMPGSPPALDEEPKGCIFAERCPFATEVCDGEEPEVTALPFRTQSVACHHANTAHSMREEMDGSLEHPESPEETARDDETPLLEVDDLYKWYEREQSWRESLPIDAASLSVSALTHNLRKWYDRRGGPLRTAFSRDSSHIRAVDGVSFSVERGQIYGIIGESGCGKSTLGETLALLETPTDGGFRFDGRSHEHYQDGRETAFRQRVQIVFQNPYDSLNPRMTVKQFVGEPLSIHGYRLDEREEALAETLRKVGLLPTDRLLDKYPHQLSGGQRQRVAIARALVLDPELLICDEPASMLDASLQAEILNLFHRLAKTENIGVLYISHDIASLTQIADRLGVMYLGRLVERGPTQTVTTAPKHPYTAALLAAIPETSPVAERTRVLLDGEPPSPVDVQDSCRFADRCPKATDECVQSEPELETWASDEVAHAAACYHPHETSTTEAEWPTTVPGNLQSE